MRKLRRAKWSWWRWKLHILNNAETPPFPIEQEISASEETRLRYRYLDLRRPKPHRNLALRHKILLEMRKTMDEMGFIEVETPMLTALDAGRRARLPGAEPRASREILRVAAIAADFKQILMIGGWTGISRL